MLHFNDLFAIFSLVLYIAVEYLGVQRVGYVG